MISSRNFVIGVVGLVMAACGGGSDTASSSSNTSSSSGSGSGSTSGIGGTWDITAFDELPSGEMGQMTIANGEITGTIPGKISETTDPALCRRTFHQIKFSISVAGDAASGQITREEKYEGTTCGTQKVGEIGSKSLATITGKRVFAKPASLTDMNGRWELSVGGGSGKAVTLILDVDGQTFSAHKEGSTKGLDGSVVGNRATATADQFEFAAQRR